MSVNPSSSLTPEQENQRRSIEERSFRSLCKQVGCDPLQRQVELLRLMEKEFRSSENLAPPDQGSPLWELNRRLRASFQAGDFWEARRLLVESNRASMAVDLVSVAPKLPINYLYLKTVAGALRVPPPSPRDPASLMRFLLAVPEVGRFDMRFSAFLEGESLIDTIPAICVYEQLLAVLKGFIDLAVPAIMNHCAPGSVDPASEALAAARGNRWLFKALVQERAQSPVL